LIVTLFVLENYSIHETMTMRRRKKSVGKRKRKKKGGREVMGGRERRWDEKNSAMIM
jgi:hypothetical protein